MYRHMYMCIYIYIILIITILTRSSNDPVVQY